MSPAAETPFLKVPLEGLKRAAKDRKSIIDEATEAVNGLAANPGSDMDELAALESLVSKLQGLKRKLAEVSRTEKEDAHRCKARLEHLRSVGPFPKSGITAWNKPRLDRILIDHLLRCGHLQVACELAHSSGSTDLVDIHLFLGAQRVVQALRNHDCTEALAWCAENSSRLKKNKSKFEFSLRLQEFVEMAKQGRRVEAIQYAKKHLAPWASLYLPEFQRTVASLVFTDKTTCSVYKPLFDEQQWEVLIDAFYKELYRLSFLPQESLLSIYLQAGLAALKTPQSYQPSCSKEDPLHLSPFQKLAEGLPFAKHVHSKLICSVTKQIMNDANPPMVLPNGYVYSQKATQAIIAQNAGKMVCPRTGQEYQPDELRRAFIA